MHEQWNTIEGLFRDFAHTVCTQFNMNLKHLEVIRYDGPIGKGYDIRLKLREK